MAVGKLAGNAHAGELVAAGCRGIRSFYQRRAGAELIDVRRSRKPFIRPDTPHLRDRDDVCGRMKPLPQRARAAISAAARATSSFTTR